MATTAHNAFQNYEHYRLIEAFQLFDEDFSNWYLRRSRRRFWRSESDAYRTLYTVLTTVTRVMAPALPFLMEEIYRNLVCSVDASAPESVHLTRYPRVDAGLIDEETERAIVAVIRIKNLALNLRTQSKVKIRQPLGTLYVRPKDAADRRVLENADYAGQILEEANLKQLVLIEDEAALVKIRLKPDAKKLGPRAGKYLKAIAQALEQADPKSVLQGGPYKIEVDVGGGIRIGAGGDCRFLWWLSGELEMQQGARDVPGARHDAYAGAAAGGPGAGLQPADAGSAEGDEPGYFWTGLAIVYAASPRLAGAIAAHEAYLRNELLAERHWEAGAAQNGAAKLSLSGEEILVTISRK